ncbi:hypothetical protein GCM10023160_21310 [Brachybacterium paraconglomeratum]
MLVIVLVVRGVGGAGGGGAEPSAADLTPEEQSTALVTDYFAALSAGDAVTSLELLPPMDEADGVLLPVEAYSTALERAPVSDVVVGTPELDGGLISGTVPVTFTVGGVSVSDEYSVHDYDDDGVIELTSTSSNPVGAYGLSGLGMTLNGVEVTDGQSLYLLPGGYEVAYSLELFAPSSTDPVIIGEHFVSPEWPEPQLTEEGLTAFRGAVQTAVDGCLAQTTLEAGCGTDTLPASTDDGWTLTEGTVRRTLPEDTQRTIDTMETTSSYDEPTYVEGEVVGSLDTEMDCTKDGQAGVCEMWLGGGMSVPHVDMADPELPVTWS